MNRIHLLATGVLALLGSLAPLSRAQESRPSGTAVIWGARVLPYVEPGTRFTAISAGQEYTMALTDDGSAVAWGDNFRSQASVPAGATSGVVA
ncbi:MAG: hypothetical protein GWO24_18115, partial [Akkermansiaceae bacterium]|nr:hypothetical protein [Akkermansiaceae bacterium]